MSAETFLIAISILGGCNVICIAVAVSQYAIGRLYLRQRDEWMERHQKDSVEWEEKAVNSEKRKEYYKTLNANQGKTIGQQSALLRQIEEIAAKSP